MIIKSLGISQLIYFASNTDVPDYVPLLLKINYLDFYEKGKRDKIKRVGLYQDYSKGGLRMIDRESMVKALKLACIFQDSLKLDIKPGRLFLNMFWGDTVD